jgi:hypothetical protein
MDDSTVNGNRAYWDSMMVEAARRHPLAMAAWLLAECAVNWGLGAQEKLEQKMRGAAA